MALIKCEECGKEISADTNKCPNCGVKTKKSKDNKKAIKIYIILIIIILLILGTVFLLKINNPLHKYSNEAISVLEDYKNSKTTAIEVHNRLNDICIKIDADYKENNKLDYYLLSSKISSIKTNFITTVYYDSYKTLTVNLDEYINELKKY